MSGKLYLVGTPIGNMGDITLRAIEILSQVDIIACEDTRTSGNLLRFHNISKKLISHHSHNQKNSTKGIIQLLQEGKNIALISDSGMPIISDPGGYLVTQARLLEIEIDIIPGPSALTTAISLAALSPPYIFLGFSPGKTGNLRKKLKQFIPTQVPLILYESPHRSIRLLTMLSEEFQNPKVTLLRELTKIHQTILTAPASEVALNPQISRGEQVFIIHPETF